MEGLSWGFVKRMTRSWTLLHIESRLHYLVNKICTKFTKPWASKPQSTMSKWASWVQKRSAMGTESAQTRAKMETQNQGKLSQILVKGPAKTHIPKFARSAIPIIFWRWVFSMREERERLCVPPCSKQCALSTRVYSYRSEFKIEAPPPHSIQDLFCFCKFWKCLFSGTEDLSSFGKFQVLIDWPRASLQVASYQEYYLRSWM